MGGGLVKAQTACGQQEILGIRAERRRGTGAPLASSPCVHNGARLVSSPPDHRLVWSVGVPLDLLGGLGLGRVCRVAWYEGSALLSFSPRRRSMRGLVEMEAKTGPAECLFVFFGVIMS